MKQSLPPSHYASENFPYIKKIFYKEFYGNTGHHLHFHVPVIWYKTACLQNLVHAWNMESTEWCIHHDITIHNRYFQQDQLHGLISTGTLKIVVPLEKNYISIIHAIGRDVTARIHLWNIILVIFYFYFKYM